MIEKNRLDLQHIQLNGPSGLEAYEVLFHMVFADLVRFAISIVHVEALAEEVVSDVLIQIWQKRAALDEIKDLRLYLYTSTRNRAINYLKSRKLGLTERTDDAVINWEEASPRLKSDELDPEALIEFAELNTRVTAAIGQLPPKCRLVYQLVKEDGLKYKEVALLLNVSVKTVEAQMALAFKKLHLALD